MRVLRNLLPLVLLAVLGLLVTACGSGSSPGAGTTGPTSGGSSGTTADTGSLELRPIYARYTSGGAPQLGPPVPKTVLEAMAAQSCPMEPSDLQGMVMECDSAKTVYLLQAPIVSGDVAKADVQQIGHTNEYLLRLTLDPNAAAALDRSAASMTGVELAFCLRGSVLTSEIMSSHFSAQGLTLTGNYKKAAATKLAGEITAS